MRRIVLLVFSFSFFLSCSLQKETADLVIINGTVYNGETEVSFKGHVAIKGDRIVYVGEKMPYIVAEDTIDARGMVVAPGFIDPHTHAGSDLSDTIRNSNLNYLTQGVTTVFIGNDGRSNTDIDAQFDRWKQQGIGTNAATYVGHSTVRRQVMGMRDTLPSPEEIKNMQSLVRRGMDAGALGLSSGLYYAPASYSNTEEVISLANIVAEYGGVYDVHLRDESSYNIGLIKAVEETVRIAESAGIPGHIAHIKCLGVDVWGKSKEVIEIVQRARERGISITADQYPYQASGTSITGALVPRWVLADGNAVEKMNNPKLIGKIKDEMRENLRKRGGPSTLLFTAPSQKNELVLGKNLEEVALEWEMDPVDAAIRIFINGGSSVASFNMNESDISEYMQQPWVMTGSDGSHGHPRKFGTYPKKIREYVLEKKVLTLGEMIHRSSSLPAETFGLERRGKLKEGSYADIIVFDPNDIRDQATFEMPYELSSGMSFVIINGQIVLRDGQYTGALAGRGLRKENVLQSQ